MNFFFIIFVPILIFVLNEFFQNKIFLAFEKFYRYSKIIGLFIPFILIYFNPELTKKILIYFKEIDKKPMHQNVQNMMSSYFDNKIHYQKNNNQFNNNNGYYNNIPNYQKNTINNNINNNNNNNNTNCNNNNFLPKKNKIKRNVSESKKKYIASNQKWRCTHCNNLLDNTYEVDHIIALYRGGTNDLTNLEALCRNCHGVKTFKEKMNI